MPELSPPAWDEFVAQYPDAHLLQTRPWGDLKAAFGWQVIRLAIGRNGAQLLLRRLPFGFSLAYLPRGPLGDDWNALWPEIDQLCRREGVIFLKVEPDQWETDPSRAGWPPSGFCPSPQTIQPPRTLVVDLRGDEDSLLNRMKQKTRYNIKLAQKKGVVVRPSADIESFYRLMTTTGKRDAFGIHSLAYYRRAYELFHPRGACELLVAEYEREPLAALMVFAHGQRAWYLYGASSDAHRDRMPTYLVQWEAMRWARAQGCTEYDLWGVPDADQTALEAQFTTRSDGLWGVYRFKRGFGGELRRTVGAWDRVYRPVLYRLYTLWLATRKLEG